MNISKVIKRPVLTEKSVTGETAGKYTFEVHSDATKVDVKNAILSLFGAQVANVNIVKAKPKFRFGKSRNLLEKRKPAKKAIITLKKGEKLTLTKAKK
ncbi:50S ribosomal protein L23 [Patescibacteria group bacterium]|nr:50S ribosomal protein L23 [Patescibacteria group bacterium]